MIKIITGTVVMPPMAERVFQKRCNDNKWVVVDTRDDSVRYRGSFNNVLLACHNLNKGYYKPKD